MNGSIEEKALPDIVSAGLKVLFVGFNPGIRSAEKGHHYAGAGNRFWKLLHESGLTDRRLSAEEDANLLEYGFGSTNIADRPTRRSDELAREELAAGCIRLAELIRHISPEIVCYVGIGVYRIFRSRMAGIPESRLAVSAGRQDDCLFEGITDYVCSNPSGLNTIPYNLQLECFKGLKKLIAADSINTID